MHALIDTWYVCIFERRPFSIIDSGMPCYRCCGDGWDLILTAIAILFTLPAVSRVDVPATRYCLPGTWYNIGPRIRKSIIRTKG